jgi:hypothetical protein
MAIVKATYTKHSRGAKASIRYIQHRPGKEAERVTRVLFGRDEGMSRQEAYRMIDAAGKNAIFFRFVLSPDPKTEDTHNDLSLRVVAEKTMQALEDRLQTEVSWVGAVHDDHAPHRHVHLVAIVQGRLYVQDFQALRQAATTACLEQRTERDLVREQTKPRQEAREQEEAQWEL